MTTCPSWIRAGGSGEGDRVISRRNAVSGTQVGLLSASLNARRNVIAAHGATFRDNARAQTGWER